MSNRILIPIIVAFAALIGGLSVYFLGPDNKVEEASEAVIQSTTGAKIDLTPDGINFETISKS